MRWDIHRGHSPAGRSGGAPRGKAVESRQAQVVECRFFGGMTEEETAEALGIGLRTVKRDWARAKLWLQRYVGAEGG